MPREHSWPTSRRRIGGRPTRGRDRTVPHPPQGHYGAPRSLGYRRIVYFWLSLFCLFATPRGRVFIGILLKSGQDNRTNYYRSRSKSNNTETHSRNSQSPEANRNSQTRAQPHTRHSHTSKIFSTRLPVHHTGAQTPSRRAEQRSSNEALRWGLHGGRGKNRRKGGWGGGGGGGRRGRGEARDLQEQTSAKHLHEDNTSSFIKDRTTEQTYPNGTDGSDQSSHSTLQPLHQPISPISPQHKHSRAKERGGDEARRGACTGAGATAW